MQKSKIPWCTHTWNPCIGCSLPLISKGCQECYARKLHNGRHKAYLEGKKLPKQYAKPFEEVQLLQDRLDEPLKCRAKNAKIFVGSMAELFGPKVPFDFIAEIENTIRKCPQHTFQILTKRPKQMYYFYKWMENHWPPEKLIIPNLWLGVSCSTQKDLWMVGKLMQIPAAVHYVSFEPLLEEIYIPEALMDHGFGFEFNQKPGRIDWAIVGCESGPNRRPCKIKWVRDIVRHCKIADIACFVKQIDLNGKVSAEPKEWPADLRRIREYPS